MADDVRICVSYSAQLNSGMASDFRALVRLFDGQNRQIGTLKFMREDHTPGNAKINPNGNVIELSYPAASFPLLLDVLRNEKPLRITFNPANNTGTVASGLESVGEGE
jgi:hypothetical protein